MPEIRADIVEYLRKRCEEEEKNPPVPRKYTDIPISYDAITTEWLTAVLTPEYPGSVVKSYSLGPKDNGTTNRRRIHLEWAEPQAENLPKSVFCKAAHALENRLMLSNGATVGEITFYNRVRSLLDIEAPVAHYAAYDPESWASIMMLHDMGDTATFCTHKSSLTKEQFAEQIQIIAKLHGRFYESKEDFYTDLAGYAGRFDNLVYSLDIETVCSNGFRAAKSVIPERMFAREAEVWPATVESVRRVASQPQTIAHGDVHLGNWYITSEGHMGLTDWQAMARGHWARDLAYVLGTGVPTKKRRLWEHDMVRLYISEFEKAGGPKVSEEEAWLELRRQSFGALWYWTFTLTPSEIIPDMQSEETTLDFIGRIAALMDDHDALDSFKGL